MNCVQAVELLGAWLDGELDSSQSQDLEAHLAECAECRTAAETFRAQDADLRRAFAPRRQAATLLAARVTDQLGGSAAVGPTWRQWPSLLVAAAAGFLLAVAILRPWRTTQPAEPMTAKQRTPPAIESDTPASPTFARMTLATGPVEVRTQAGFPWAVCPPDSVIAEGYCVRTGPATRCELTTAAGAAVRLNADTEVQFTASKQWDLSRGQMWSDVPADGSPLSVRAASATIVTDPGKFDLRCASDSAVLTVVEGAATIAATDEQRKVEAGKKVTIVEGELTEDVELYDPVLETAWINALLVRKGAENPELAERINRSLAKLGRAKLSLLYEDEIRSLGDYCVLPLLRFVQSPESDDDPQRRIIAARMIADVATAQSIPDLIEMLGHSDAQVRYHAARGLERLTGRDQGLPPERWQSDPWPACQPTHKRWQAWWDQNRDRYPVQPAAQPSKSA